jgi:predicted secreted Zn-dependent protease
MFIVGCLLIIQSFLLIPSAHPNEDPGAAEKESINWRQRRQLQWGDFKGQPVASAPNAALTSTSILISFGYDNKALTYNLQCVFYPEKSWTKVKSVRILAHEQGHFDISQLFTRKLHKALSEYRFSEGSVDRDVMDIYQKIGSQQAAFQQQYDKETNYSRDASQQLIWQEKIEEELRSLSKFASYP